MSLLDKSEVYKPFKYPIFERYRKKQIELIWTPDEITLHKDVLDWKKNLTNSEKKYITHLLRFFTQSDVDVAGYYKDFLIPYFKNQEVGGMLTTFAFMETIHIESYALLIEELGLPEVEFSMFRHYEAMLNKHNYIKKFNMNNDREVLKTIAVFSGFVEGLQLFGSFAMLLNITRFNKMPGLGTIVTYSVRDESLHTEGMTELFKLYSKELGCLDKSLKSEIRDIAKIMVDNELAFIDLAFGENSQDGLNKDSVKTYIKYLCDFRLTNLGIKTIYNIKNHPLPWLYSLLNGVEFSNFFETKSTEYSKGSLSSNVNWGGVL